MIDSHYHKVSEIRYCINHQFSSGLIQYLIPDNLCRLLWLHYFSLLNDELLMTVGKLSNFRYHVWTTSPHQWIDNDCWYTVIITDYLKLDIVSIVIINSLVRRNSAESSLHRLPGIRYCINCQYLFNGEEKEFTQVIWNQIFHTSCTSSLESNIVSTHH